jgi:hypothetical protein
MKELAACTRSTRRRCATSMLGWRDSGGSGSTDSTPSRRKSRAESELDEKAGDHMPDKAHAAGTRAPSLFVAAA